MERKVPHRLFEKLASAEQAFPEKTFLSPVLLGRPIQVRIDGIVLSLAVVEPKAFEGWGVFQPTSFSAARWVREASRREKANYFNLFPKVRFILVMRTNRSWLGLPLQSMNQPEMPTPIDLAPIGLTESCERFEIIEARFDGKSFWYETKDRQWSGQLATRWREELAAGTEIDSISHPEIFTSSFDCLPNRFRRKTNALVSSAPVCGTSRPIGFASRWSDLPFPSRNRSEHDRHLRIEWRNPPVHGRQANAGR